jgi:hypothetical protein
MKENKKDMGEMQQLAEAGWEQMHELLVQNGLTVDAPQAIIKRKFYWPAAAVLFLLLTLFFPYFLNNNHTSDLNKTATSIHASSDESASASHKPVTVTQSVIMISPLAEKSRLFLQEKNVLSQNANPVIVDSKRQMFTLLIKPSIHSNLQKNFREKIISESCLPVSSAHPKSEVKDSLRMRDESVKKGANGASRAIRIFAGAGLNATAGNNNSGSFLDHFNLHPGITLIIPFSQKLSLHTGLWAFSTIHGKETGASERQLAASVSSALYYNVNTTSIIKASYFDVPLTLNYSFHNNWKVGGGIQFSKLYKINIRVKIESFDYNNQLFSATVNQYNSTPARAAARFEKMLEIKEFEPRLMGEVSFQHEKWLLSAGYYYGFGKTITLRETDNTTHYYRNQYFKLGVQYQVSGKK